MEDILLLVREEMEEAIKNMEKRFSNVRAGRASASVLDGVMAVLWCPNTINTTCNYLSSEARTLMIKPFDKNALAADKKEYMKQIGLTPNNNGESITIAFPPLTEEERNL